MGCQTCKEKGEGKINWMVVIAVDILIVSIYGHVKLFEVISTLFYNVSFVHLILLCLLNNFIFFIQLAPVHKVESLNYNLCVLGFRSFENQEFTLVNGWFLKQE